MRYELTKPREYLAAIESAPIAYLPWGAHEWHGQHNPLGLDSLKSHAHCQALCAQTGGIVFPPVYCGHQTMKPYAGFKCTLEFSPECVRLLARCYLDQLADEGFRVVVIVMGHYGGEHVALLQGVVSEFNAAQDACAAWAFADYEPTKPVGFAGDHAAAGETSYMMALYPELVDLERLPWEGELDPAKEGVHGRDPRTQASAKWGQDALRALVENASPRILQLLAAKAG